MRVVVFLFSLFFTSSAFAGVCITGWEQVRSAKELSYLESDLARSSDTYYVNYRSLRCENVKELSHDLQVIAIAMGAASIPLCSFPATLKAGILVGLTSSALFWLDAELNDMPCEEESEQEKKERLRYEICLDLEKQGVNCNPQRVEIRDAVGIPGLEI